MEMEFFFSVVAWAILILFIIVVLVVMAFIVFALIVSIEKQANEGKSATLDWLGLCMDKALARWEKFSP